MICIDRKENCTGCEACRNICHNNAIQMVEDQEGFKYPVIDYSKCNQCGQCEVCCPALKEDIVENPGVEKVFAAWSKDEECRYLSTSGGIFSEIAMEVIDNGGHVVGARYKEDFTVEHCMITKKSELEKIRQSKYVQSDIGEVFRRIKQELEEGYIVLFCGTPCQNAGLKSYLRKEYKNLITCDFICRGVNSPKAYRQYLEYLREDYKSDISKIIFKEKSNGWNQFSTVVEFSNGSVYKKGRNEDLYMLGYLKYNLYIRPSCHQCKFKGKNIVSDLTLGDFWGIGKEKSYLDENKGTSVVIVNTKKGEEIFNRIKEHIESEECQRKQIIKGNPCMLQAVEKGKYREKFFEGIDAYPFDILMQNIMDED